MKKLFFKAISLIMILNIVVTTSGFSSTAILEQKRSDMPDIVEATIEYLDIIPDNDTVKMEGQLKAGKLNVPINCIVEMYRIKSDAYDNGNYINPYADMVKGYKEYSKTTVLAQVELKQNLNSFIFCKPYVM